MARIFILWCTIATLSFTFGIDTDIEYQANNKYIINARIPRFVNKDNILEELPGGLKQVNREIDDDFTKIKRDVVSSALQFSEEFPNSNLLPFTVTSNYVFTRNVSDTISFFIETSYYTGGAHPATVYKGYILNKDKHYQLNDLFKNPREARSYIVTSIKNDIKANLLESERGETEKIYFDEFHVDLSDATYYLKEDKLVILFQQYTIAPYSSGNPQFEFPLTSLKTYLNKKWMGF